MITYRTAQRPIRSFLKTVSCIGLLCLFTTTAQLHAQLTPSLNQIKETLQEPVTVLLKNGSTQTGEIASWDETTLRLEVSLGGGIAELAYPRDDIRELAFPGGNYKSILSEWMQSPNKATDAMELFRAYYMQRGAYFSLLDQQELYFFVRYAEFALEQDKPLRAVAMIDAVRPHVTDEGIIRRLDESLLLGLFNGGMREEAVVKAREWIQDAEPAGASALGWRLLAELHFENEDYEDAFWTAMHPVAFSNQMPMAHLDACYAFAILASLELRLKEEPSRLAQEMTQRAIQWPENVQILSGKRPADLFTEADTEPAEEPEETTIELEPLQTPSPIDPVESLPTRIYN